ncbi:MAG TPA: phosphatase PAP2 family protein [Baekduia sp.]|uniref:phosphatase PAP2 family protein n=1 Tax=Baekduia sp. TaxID=2600305 RepID=UPI002BE8C875|nr:phosphatase PAP2 family protein [Baekduia sp.]HMJ36253.1 phosphatase PAP2 family protein [Baekduia sp.]
MSWRTVSALAQVAYLAGLVIVTVMTGLPLERTQLFFWILLGLAVVSLRGWRSWGRMLLEWLPLLALLVVYDYLRGAASVPAGQAHVSPQIDVDRWLGGGQVPTVWLQHHLYDPSHLRWYDAGIWCTYLSHFFVIWIVAAVLWKVAHDRFGRYVSVVVLVTLMAFLTYWLYPAQPPWLAGELGEIPPVDKIVPTVWDRLGVPVAADLFETGDGLVNRVAAMPSLHAAYPAMLLLFFWTEGRWWRIGWSTYTLAMGFSLVYGGEHFVVDIVLGWLYAGIAFATVHVAWPAVRHARVRPGDSGDRAGQAEPAGAGAMRL